MDDVLVIQGAGENFATIVDSDDVPRPVMLDEAQMAVWCGVPLIEIDR